LRLGTETFYDYLDAFGFGQKTGVDIPGEGTGIVISRDEGGVLTWHRQKSSS
ncbi:MAG: hypothetical protein II259_10535, partial [Selenomonadaceae bacterium]|nr:hypothetical protein [Selenomonadaceae bacterium]